MECGILDLKQFFEFCQVQNCLKTIAEENHQTTHKLISKLIPNAKTIIANSLKLKSPLSKFCKLNKFKAIDLDLIQIALTEQTTTTNPEKYLEKSILEEDNKHTTPQTIKKLAKSTIIKGKYLKLNNPFEEDKTQSKKEKKNKRTILKLLNSKEAKTTSKKSFELKFKEQKYTQFNQIIEDIHILDKILNIKIDQSKGISKKIINKIYNTQLTTIKNKYDKTLKQPKHKFSKFLNKYELQLQDNIILIKHLTEQDLISQKTYNLSDELIVQFKDEKIMNKLLSKKLLKKSWGWVEIGDKTIKELLNLKPTNDENEKDVVIIEKPKENFKNICLAKDIKDKIITTINQEKNSDQIFKKWGLEESIGYGKGTTLNLSGPPGTGKTLSAKAIANHLNKKLLTINYPELESAWIGETEKNISKAFARAKKANAVLFFDEADSLTTKRQNASATWIISRTNTLLKELEAFEGVCIFATNFSENYDEAFNRRLSAHIQFRLPKKEQLTKIFKLHFPKKEALHKDVNFEELTNNLQQEFSGGDVKNVVLNAARIASNDNSNKDKTIKQNHLIEACHTVQTGKMNNEMRLEETTNYFG